MTKANTYVHARVDHETKERAADTLAAMGLTISDAIRLLLRRIADEDRLPFDFKRPNAVTLAGMAELDAGGGTSHDSISSLMAELRAGD